MTSYTPPKIKHTVTQSESLGFIDKLKEYIDTEHQNSAYTEGSINIWYTHQLRKLEHAHEVGDYTRVDLLFKNTMFEEAM